MRVIYRELGGELVIREFGSVWEMWSWVKRNWILQECVNELNGFFCDDLHVDGQARRRKRS
jgi:hypothetical protein